MFAKPATKQVGWKDCRAQPGVESKRKRGARGERVARICDVARKAVRSALGGKGWIEVGVSESERRRAEKQKVGRWETRREGTSGARQTGELSLYAEAFRAGRRGWDSGIDEECGPGKLAASLHAAPTGVLGLGWTSGEGLFGTTRGGVNGPSPQWWALAPAVVRHHRLFVLAHRSAGWTPSRMPD